MYHVVHARVSFVLSLVAVVLASVPAWCAPVRALVVLLLALFT